MEEEKKKGEREGKRKGEEEWGEKLQWKRKTKEARFGRLNMKTFRGV